MSYDPNPLQTTYTALRVRVAANVDSVLPKATYIGQSSKEPAALKQARLYWDMAVKALNSIESAINAASRGAVAVAVDPDLNSEARSRKISEVADGARAQLAGLTEQAIGSLKKVLDILQSAGFPARPQPETAVQEAKLAGLKSDLRMMLDPEVHEAITERLDSLLTRAVAEGDDLLVWLLVSTHWVEDYLKARREDLEVLRWAHVSSTRLRSFDDGLSEVRSAYVTLSDPQQGIPVLEVLLASTLPNLLNDAVGGLSVQL